MKKVLLHICCGVCAGYPVEKLRGDGYLVTGYFYNPNIDDEAEYLRRLEAAIKLSQIVKFEMIAGPYAVEDWKKSAQGLEREKEGGKRCDACFKVRLEQTFLKAKELDFDFFASTLSVSPHKDIQRINAVGSSLSARFLPCDFKKNGGFKKTSGFAATHKLYRQNFCGCSYSKAESRERSEMKAGHGASGC